MLKAKKYAKSTGDSLSGLVGNYLKAISNTSHEQVVELTPLIKSLKGSFKADHDIDYKKELQQELSKKYPPVMEIETPSLIRSFLLPTIRLPRRR